MPHLGRFSFMGFDPFFILKTKNKRPFEQLRQLLKKYSYQNCNAAVPFLGGAVGYFAYDLGFLIERIESYAKDDLNLPDCFLGFYDCTITIDHLKNKLYIFSTGLPETKGYFAKKRARHRLKEVLNILSKANLKENHCLEPKTSNVFKEKLEHLQDFHSNFSKAKYLLAVKKALNYIAKGDIYQVNLSQRFSVDSQNFKRKKSDLGFDLYRQLRSISPSTFSGYMDCADFKIISSSPERFLRLKGMKVETRPMKGTRPRGKNYKQDYKLRNELLKSAKDKAELLMITDLERNDLGKVCSYGSVKVKNIRRIEEYSSVFQATSLVEGRLHKDKDCVDLIKGCFPGGSITGCPKIRSMEIIEELEPTKRSIYTGSLGYISFNQNMDLNILIRTLLLKGDKIYFQVGGGIVADSKPESEYEETLVKAQAMVKAINTLRRQ